MCSTGSFSGNRLSNPLMCVSKVTLGEREILPKPA
jgi:hypothetical protein